jgi:hypothetical protein
MAMSTVGFSLSVWIRATSSTSGHTAFLQCKVPVSGARGFVVGFDQATDAAKLVAYNMSAGDATATVVGTLAEDAKDRPYNSSTWVHYTLTHASTGNSALIYRDGALVKSGEVQYQWQAETLACTIFGANDVVVEGISRESFGGDAMSLYYWNNVIIAGPVALTRMKGTPQHRNAVTNVNSVMGGYCQDVNECDLGIHTCSTNDLCTNTFGSFVCAYTGEVQQVSVQGLQDTDECPSLNSTVCGTTATCYNTLDSYACMCPSSTTHNVSFSSGSGMQTSSSAMSADGLTMTMWVQAGNRNSVTVQSLFECLHPQTQALHFSMALLPKTNVLTYMLGDVNQQIDSPATTTPAAGAWTHFALLHDRRNGSSIIYRDGVRVAEVNMVYLFKDSDLAQCTFGQSVRSDWTDFTGTMQGVYVWWRPLSVQEVCVCMCVCVLHVC